MKKDDALMALVARSKERILSKIDTTLVQETTVPVPVIFASSINQIESKIATYRQKMISGEQRGWRQASPVFLMRNLTFCPRFLHSRPTRARGKKIVDAVEVIYADTTTLE